MAAAEELVRSHVDVLADEMDRAIGNGEVDAVVVIRIESPGDGPIHDAAGPVAGRVHGAGAPAGNEPGEKIPNAVDFPIDGLNGLALGDIISTGAADTRRREESWSCTGDSPPVWPAAH